MNHNARKIRQILRGLIESALDIGRGDSGIRSLQRQRHFRGINTGKRAGYAHINLPDFAARLLLRICKRTPNRFIQHAWIVPAFFQVAIVFGDTSGNNIAALVKHSSPVWESILWIIFLGLLLYVCIDNLFFPNRHE